MPNRLANETSPYLFSTRTIRSIGTLGARGACRGQAEQKPIFSVDRLLGLPLVPRDGARELRERGDRRAHERALRLHQGRSRRATRPRSDLHERRADDDRPRRLADERVSDARSEAVLRRHLLATARVAGHARFRPGDGRRRRMGNQREDSRSDRSDQITATLAQTRQSRDAGDALDRLLARCRHIAQVVRSHVRRIWRRAEISRADGLQALAAPLASHRETTSSSMVTSDARPHGAGASTITWAAGLPATRSTPVGSCRTSRRCCTTTPSSRHVSRGLSRHRRRDYAASCARRSTTCCAT